MQKNIFDEILIKGIKAGKVPAKTEDARKWYRDAASKVRNLSENRLMSSNQDRLTTLPKIGNMYLFEYDAKMKEELPYWDSMPLIFPVKMVKDGFYGINLHYLPPQTRAKLMDALYELKSNSRYDETTRLYMGYRLLNSAAKLRAFKPCLKHYLFPQVKSRFMYVHPTEWDVALFLPLARFNKASNQRVWRDSERAIARV